MIDAKSYNELTQQFKLILIPITNITFKFENNKTQKTPGLFVPSTKYQNENEMKEFGAQPLAYDEWPSSANAFKIPCKNNTTILDFDDLTTLEQFEKATSTKLIDYCSLVIRTSKGMQFFFQPANPHNLKHTLNLLPGLDLLMTTQSFAHPINNPQYYKIEKYEPSLGLLPLPQSVLDYLIDLLNPLSTSNLHFEEELLTLNFNTKWIDYEPIYYTIQKWNSTENKQNLVEYLKIQLLPTKLQSIDFNADLTGKRNELYTSIVGRVLEDPSVLDKDEAFNFIREISLTLLGYNKDHAHLSELESKLRTTFSTYWKQKPFKLQSVLEKYDKLVKIRNKSKDYSFWKNSTNQRWIICDNTTNTIQELNRQDFMDELRHFNPSLKEKMTDYLATLPRKMHVFNPSNPWTTFYDEEKNFECYNEARVPQMLNTLLKDEQTSNTIPPYIDALLKNILPNDAERNHFLHNLAYHIRTFEHRPILTCIIGGSGVGKSKFCSVILREIFQHYYIDLYQSSTSTRFNSQLENKTILVRDDVKMNLKSETNLLDQIFATIDTQTIEIEKKGRDPIKVKNHTFQILLSNSLSAFSSIDGIARRVEILTSGNKPLHKALEHLERVDNIDQKFRSETPDFVRYLLSIPLDRATYIRQFTTRRGELKKQADQHLTTQLTESIASKDIYPLLENAEFRGDVDIETIQQWKQAAQENKCLENLSILPAKLVSELFGFGDTKRLPKEVIITLKALSQSIPQTIYLRGKGAYFCYVFDENFKNEMPELPQVTPKF